MAILPLRRKESSPPRTAAAPPAPLHAPPLVVPDDISLAPSIPPPRREDRRARPRDWLRVGIVALALLAAGTALAVSAPRERDAPAVVAHRRFLAGFGVAGPQAPAGLPDLSALGLRLDSASEAGGGLYGGYRGTGGCRLGLWLGGREAVPTRIPPGWRTALLPHEAGVLWLAAEPGMQPARFAALAAAIVQPEAAPPASPLGEPPCPD
ncbi:hypothetical protein [Teichococcus aestuarii]|uniref:hypothetical protein n=1 Tax=Teichococcus aestuarii TaxID=568898 RepID=UPI001FEC73FB|nr:hypothetical protein [Pseudoroseomonas aestuarii]